VAFWGQRIFTLASAWSFSLMNAIYQAKEKLKNDPENELDRATSYCNKYSGAKAADHKQKSKFSYKRKPTKLLLKHSHNALVSVTLQ
jgi:hypothetical protein